LFSYAPQGNLLLSGTLRENILLARPDASEAQLEKALYVSAMDEYVAALPQGLDTVLGENGAGLSEGQSQRISLARAILADAPILLLDEVTSALDVQTEKTVLERICALPGKTCIAVTHRPAALSLASCRIEVTDRGMTVC
jgi:ATP-binding cassette subfamily B protein